MDVLLTIVVLVAVYLSFAVSASAGLGGSLLLVPTLALFLGTKEGVALAALLLASNNVVKIYAYRRTLPFRKSAPIILLIMIGAAIGSALLVRASTVLVTVAVITMFAATMIAERFELDTVRTRFAPFLAFVSGASSGFSGTSGPLKGAAIRNLNLDRQHFVGAASLAAFAGDATKAAIFTDAELLGTSSVLTAVAAVPLMILGTWTGSTFNKRTSERSFAILFWSVMCGYTVRLGVFVL
ncbi:MAG: sulfite exporter TauE/SafE family protein [Acidimicrobiia bacterium]|nr:sulfite exporter TauE/SafE family protein [Acidimicrobiia bacterium]